MHDIFVFLFIYLFCPLLCYFFWQGFKEAGRSDFEKERRGEMFRSNSKK